MLPTWNSARTKQRSCSVPFFSVKSLQLLLALAASLPPAQAKARDLWSDDFGDRYITLNTALKSTLLLGDQAPPGEGAQATNFWRLRFDLEMVPEPWLVTELSYEQRLVLETNPSPLGGVGQFLPPIGEFPYQIVPLGDAIIDQRGFRYEHNYDRMAVGVRGNWGQVKLGRQAIGFGRSMFFTATDVLSPFGTFQVDQEWKAGVDALDAQVQVADTVSVGATVAAEQDFDDAAVLGRAQGYFGDVDLALLGGKRSEDFMVGLASSTQLFDAALSLELSYFQTDGNGVPEPQFGDLGVLKAVVGGSYSFDIRGGLTWTTEYHFNGFGISDVRRGVASLLDPNWIARLQRGDFQTIGQHELATALSLVATDDLTATAYTVLSPVDGSGLVSFGGSWNTSNHLSLDLSAFAPWGAGLDASGAVPSLGSEYGAGALTVYLAMRLYD